MQAAGLRLFLYRWQMRAFVFLFSEVLRKGEKSDSGDRTISNGLPKSLSGLGGEDS